MGLVELLLGEARVAHERVPLGLLLRCQGPDPVGGPDRALGRAGKTDGLLTIALGGGLVALPEEHVGGHHVVVGLLRPLHGAVRPVQGPVEVPEVLVQPAQELRGAGADGEELVPGTALGVLLETVEQLDVARDRVERVAGAEQVRGLVVTGHRTAQMADEEFGVDRGVEVPPAGGRLRRAPPGLRDKSRLLPRPVGQAEHAPRDVESVGDPLDEIDLLDLALPGHDLAHPARCHVAGASDE